MLASGSFLPGAVDIDALELEVFFLKLGIWTFVDFGLEKNDESDFASFTTGFVSFTGTAFALDEPATGTATFFAGGAAFADAGSAFRFLPLVSVTTALASFPWVVAARTDMTHPLFYRFPSCFRALVGRSACSAISVRGSMPCP
ncbi:hypothetical protein NUW54_g12785 [Trametes sanguinea]|uniref:Uncharacterized protein n=1 Tax=Trametes sanguinea TaxID=158606 RepID=A0ACC1MU50_9APHY|nr:hypothetical protein NUW54_g12785 [Trametes sanguinea]